MGLTAQLAQYVADSKSLTLDEAVRTTVRTGFIDTVAVMLAGRDEPVVQVVRRFVASQQGGLQQARILLGPHRCSSRDAALINACAGHALDYDDVGLMGHPSVVLVPALLAEGERLKSSGLDLMRAYVVGYEVWAELLARDPQKLHDKGWHPTAVFGVLAAAAAVACLRGFDAVQARHALGIAASMAGGLIANFGSMVKPFHAGQAAAHGIDAANLASLGLTASADTIEHRCGFLAAFSPQGQADSSPLQQGLCTRQWIKSRGLGVKKYPMCFATHRVIDAVVDLSVAHDLKPEQIRHVKATIGKTQALMLRNVRPTTALEAKFSLQFAVAAALVARRVGLAELVEAFVQRDDVRRLFECVEVETTDTVCPQEATLALSDRVVIETLDGQVYDSGEVYHARGSFEAPLLARDLESKFLDCVSGAPMVDGPALLRRLSDLDGCSDVGQLFA
ncbi:MAG: MmgE/PrpD family protein [Burkholderiaceae bacterium]|nr:MmgE/PrpD family protein [Burkholderiaceae bacterium]